MSSTMLTARDLKKVKKKNEFLLFMKARVGEEFFGCVSVKSGTRPIRD